jgi:magnesium-transporting ATPase (P-type)
MGKKKQRLNPDEETEPEPNPINGNTDDSHSNKKLKKKKNKKIKTNEIPTVSIAVPASIIDNVPTLELATRVPISISLSFPTQKYHFCSKNENLIHSEYNFFFFWFSLFSWLVKLLVPRPFFESMRFLMMFYTFSYVTLIIIIIIIVIVIIMLLIERNVAYYYCYHYVA